MDAIDHIQREKLEAFVDGFGNYEFESKYYDRQIMLFAYHLQFQQEWNYFQAQDIQNCYTLLDLQAPATLQLIQNILEKAKNDGILITRNAGYRFSRSGTKRYKPEVEGLEAPQAEKTYTGQEGYTFYTDLKAIISKAEQEVFVVNPYSTENTINLYLNDMPVGIKIRMLTNKSQGNLLSIAQKFKEKHLENFSLKENGKCHDRLFFIDKKCYVTGQSLDNAASGKPTYLIAIQDSGQFRQIFQKLFDEGKTLA